MQPKPSKRVKAGQLRPRLSGLSLFPPNLEFSFPEPSARDADVARELLAFFEDRRVLCAPEHLEIFSHCIESVLEIRRFLTAILGRLDKSSDLIGPVRTIRAACRKFLDQAQGPASRYLMVPGHAGLSEWTLWPALGELRGITGVCVATIAERYGVDVDVPLASILPPEPKDSD